MWRAPRPSSSEDLTMKSDCPELRNALARRNIHLLTAGVVLQAALMPLILYGGFTSRAGTPVILAATYGLEAVCFLSMAIIRSSSRQHVLQLWMSGRQSEGNQKASVRRHTVLLRRDLWERCDMRYRSQGWVVKFVKWAAMLLLLQGVAAAQDDDGVSITAVGSEFAATIAPRTEPKVEANHAGRALWIASVAALAVANIADASSSWSKNEGNRVLAGGGGTFGAKGAAIKGGINAAWIAGQVIALRKNKAHRSTAIVNFAAASIFGALAYRNRSIPAPAGGLR
jgi:hypothetical protein